MSIPTGVIYAAGVAAIPILSRLWVRYKRDRRQRREYQLPLFDAVLLEVALTPRTADADDPDVLIEMRETLAHLNRRSFASEFWGLDEHLAAYYERLPAASRPTMRRALLRLIGQPDRWLQAVAAKTSARLGMGEAADPVRALLEEKEESGNASRDADARFRTEMEAALASLERSPEDTEQAATRPV